MKQILWFRRDLRIEDSAILANAKDKVLPIFIFDTNILNKLDKNDKRVTFIYNSVLQLKEKLKQIGLDLAIFYGEPKAIFSNLVKLNFNEVLVSIDYDDYAIQRDKDIETIIKMRRFLDSFILMPNEHLKSDGTPYKVFTYFYKSLYFIYNSDQIIEHNITKKLKLVDFNYSHIPTLEEMGFSKQTLPDFLGKNAFELLNIFVPKLKNYIHNRDFWNIDATSKLSVHLRFGLISPRQIFNKIKKYDNSDKFIRQLFWREFYNYILYHYPKTQYQNLLPISPKWRNNIEEFEKWKNGETGVPLVDAAMRHLNQTGTLHNRLRMIVSSFLCKNLLIDWKWGEKYFANKLLDYEASSNIGSWQWAASTGADAAPYFRFFNPYIQSAKYDKDALFIKNVIDEFKNIDSSIIHKEGIGNSIFVNYIKPIVSIKYSRQRALDAYR